ncbi:Mitochondrial import inner membrane translocase subunit TIM50 [Golovinomyces cichoracearum]|uniref:Mitochondrial import inner membrane translocase subunit TIM50 n=1 Tax=Golovinomyces cichoracearum TaxID=62708 RepID=A0A420HZN3_9PEZI|nr:Mitochondrial import inner membrane translocase subunit TIM50 [Golovinomyces cichoracearum]
MLSRSIIRSTLTPGIVGSRSHLVCLRLSSSRVWSRPVTSSNGPDGTQKISSAPPRSFGSTPTDAQENTFKARTSPNIDQTHGNLSKSFFTNPAANNSEVRQPPLESVHKRNLGNTEKQYNEPHTNANATHNPASPNLFTSEPQTEESQYVKHQLPDLTQGIPSTLEYEATGKYPQSDLNLLHVKESFESSGARGRSSLPSSAYVSSLERKRLQVANYVYGTFILMSLLGTLYLGRNWETEEEEKGHEKAPSGWSLSLFWKRAKARVRDELDYYQAPAFEKLLPDEDPMFKRPYTLVLSLEELLICSEWSREHGWRLAKRPGVDYFIRYLSQYFELVVFTTQPYHLAEPIIRKFDPYHIIMWPLFREATKYENGKYLKDISYLNRDLAKVIVIDTEKTHVSRQPENAIILEPWRGDPNDKELVSLIPFLEYIHTMAYPDVRKAIKSFEGKHIPTEFARREAIARKKFLEQLEEEKKRKPRRSGLGLLGDALGIKHQSMMMDPNEQTPSEAFAQGKMLQDQARERGQRNYELLEKEIRENGEEWLKQESALEEKSKEESLEAMKTSLTGWFKTGPENNIKK